MITLCFCRLVCPSRAPKELLCSFHSEEYVNCLIKVQETLQEYNMAELSKSSISIDQSLHEASICIDEELEGIDEHGLG